MILFSRKSFSARFGKAIFWSALLVCAYVPAATFASDLVWDLNANGNYVVQVKEVNGKLSAFLRNRSGTWALTNPNLLKALRKGLVIKVDGKILVPGIANGLPPLKTDSAVKIKNVEVSLYGHDLAHVNSTQSGFKVSSEYPLSAYDVRSFATDEGYAKNFVPTAKILEGRFGTDLHTHLAGHIPFQSLVEIGYQHDVDYPVFLLDKAGIKYPKDKVVEGKIRFKTLVDSKEFKDAKNLVRLEDAMMIEPSQVRTFLDMENRYLFRGPITKNVGAFRDMLWSVAEASSKSGVTYAEQSISNILDPEWLRIAETEVPKIEKATGVKIRFLAGLWRHSDPEWNLDEITRLRRMARASPYIVGVDFMGHETNSSEDLTSQIHAASELKKEFGEGFQVRLHAGENPLTPANVRVASEEGANRVGHGLYIEKDPVALRADPLTVKIEPKVLDQLKKSNTYIELNPVSNQALNNLSGGSDVLYKQFAQFKEAGIPVVLGSDGIGMYGADHREIERMLLQLGFSHDDFEYVKTSEKKYLQTIEGSFRDRAKQIAKSGSKVPTKEELQSFVKKAGEHYTPELSKSRAAEAQKKLEHFKTDFSKKGIIAYDSVSSDFKGMKAIDVSGGSKSQFASLEKEGRLSELKIPEIRENFKSILERLDPKKVFFLTGGTQFGVEKILHEEIGKFNALHAETKFSVVGVLPEAANAEDVFGPLEGGLTHYKLAGKGWSDFATHKLDILLDHGGAKVAVAGKMFVADEFRSVINAALPIKVLHHDGPVGASSDLAKTNPSGAYKTADDLLAKIVGDHPDEYLSPSAILKRRASQLNRQVFDSPEDVIRVIKGRKKKVLTFVGYSGAEYENPDRMLEEARTILLKYDPKTTLINGGGTPEGIGKVYELAKEMGFETTGISRVKYRDGTSPFVDRPYFLNAEKSGGFIPGTTDLEPVSKAMVGVSDEVIAIGGGKIGADEVVASHAAGKPITFFAADMNHAVATQAAEKKGLSLRTEFKGEVHQAVLKSKIGILPNPCNALRKIF